MPKLPAKAKKLKALAWVLGVLFSVIMLRTVTIVPAKTPARHLKRIICQMALLSPKIDVAIATPINELTRTGFLPKRSAARPHEIMTSIWVNENRDSISPL